MAAFEPRNRTRGLLGVGDRPSGLAALLRRQDAGHSWDVTAQDQTAGFSKYIATLLPISGFSTDSAVRVSHGRLIMSHTSSL